MFVLKHCGVAQHILADQFGFKCIAMAVGAVDIVSHAQSVGSYLEKLTRQNNKKLFDKARDDQKEKVLIMLADTQLSVEEAGALTDFFWRGPSHKPPKMHSLKQPRMRSTTVLGQRSETACKISRCFTPGSLPKHGLCCFRRQCPKKASFRLS